MNQISTAMVDLEALKARQQATWASADYSMIGTTLQIVGESLCETIDISAGSAVLDIAAGNGNATLAAARRFCRITSTDYVPAVLEHGRARAAAEGLDVRFQVEDAEALSFRSASFDVVLSTFGVMFAADPPRAAREMLRVCRPGGTIGLANWTPDGFIGQLFRAIGRHVPPPAGARSPLLWGTDATIHELFGDGASEIAIHPRKFVFRYLSADHFLDTFRRWYGPTLKAFAAAGERAPELDADLRMLLHAGNRATDGTLIVPSDYVEVMIRRR